jgi:hypothetical protein
MPNLRRAGNLPLTASLQDRHLRLPVGVDPLAGERVAERQQLIRLGYSST